eukprot:4188221-Lingulodinium_polyedra.AAC.1
MSVLGHGLVLNMARRVEAPVTIAFPTATRVQVVALATGLPRNHCPGTQNNVRPWAKSTRGRVRPGDE